MTLRNYLLGIAFSTVLCAVAFIFVIFNINPEETNSLGFILFYTSLALTLVGSFTILGFILRRIVSKNEIIFAHVGVSLRQGVLLSICVIGILLLQSSRLLSLMTGGLLISSLSLMELFFESH
ncbi:hypothetical protein COY23_00330 [bacterium (Candidatus Torokbacteria) CG_4_10_14_0_2_um_filter_35_8]|nr:MAG: hypothetical protein COY23_00330 [bacterium (Candidatus Torokbacteria) CG_4_10_14_0_2_um_filter_35_8]